MNFGERFREWRKRQREQDELEKREAQAVKMDPSDKGILTVICVLFTIYSVTLFFPLVWLFFNSLKDKVEFLNNPWQFGGKVLWSNYKTVFGAFNFGAMFFNSITLVLTQPIVGLFSTTCAAYAVSKFRFRSRKFIYFIAISVMFIPTTGSLAVTYKLMFDSRLIDTLPGMIIMATGGFGFNFLLIYNTFRGISWSYAEAAYVDGAGNWRVFLQIMLPHAAPILTAVLILSMIGTWNDYTGPLMFYSNHETVAVGIKRLSDSLTNPGQYSKDYPKLFAAMIISTVPVIILFIACQKYIIRLNMGGGLKE